MKKILTLFIFLPILLVAQPFRTVSFTGDAGADFNVNEKYTSNVTWCLTWDGTNMFIGVHAGATYAKDQPSIIYFDTDPQLIPNTGTGGTGGFNSYDGRIGTYPFTANVVVYFKAGYAEMRLNSGGTWGSATVLTSNVTTGTNDIELFIPWTNFPSSVRPSQLYYILYKEDGGGGTLGYAFAPSTNRSDGNDVNAISNWSYFSASSTADGGIANSFSSSDTPLPVELTSFSASSKNKSVNLVWKTVTEMNNYGFEIQRSANNGSFTKVGFVNGSGNSNSANEYSYTDKTATSGKYIYRLKQIDNDGKYEYSKEVEVDLGKPTTFALNQNYPNPFNPTTVISYQLPANSYVTLKVYNAIGTEVTTLVNEYKEAGSYNYEFGSAKGGRNYELTSGIYFYTLRAGDFVQTKKMILLK